MGYQIEIKHSARKEIEYLPKRDQRRIIAVIEKLSGNPRPEGVRKLTGAEDLYRIRVGDYRIVYQICDKKLVVWVIRIGHRKDIYKRI